MTVAGEIEALRAAIEENNRTRRSGSCARRLVALKSSGGI